MHVDHVFNLHQVNGMRMMGQGGAKCHMAWRWQQHQGSTCGACLLHDQPGWSRVKLSSKAVLIFSQQLTHLWWPGCLLHGVQLRQPVLPQGSAERTLWRQTGHARQRRRHASAALCRLRLLLRRRQT